MRACRQQAATAAAAAAMPLLLSSSFWRLVPLLLAALSARRIAVEAALVTEDLQLVWHDEFNGGSVDWDKWVVDEGDGCDVDLCDWGNGEKQASILFFFQTTSEGGVCFFVWFSLQTSA